MTKIIPVTRSGVVGHSARYFESLGAPAERLLQQAGIPAHILDIPDAVVRLQNAYRCLASSRARIWLCTAPIDMRKSFNGLQQKGIFAII